MGTAILRSHDCLPGRFRNDALALATSHVRSPRCFNNPNPNVNFSSHQNRRQKRSPVNNHQTIRHRSGDRPAKKVPAAASLVSGQVKILKRGEKWIPENRHIEARAKSVDNLDLLLGSTNRLGPDPVMVQRQIMVPVPKDVIYAGSAFVASPPPSSVPVPAFLGKNGAATSDLRRLLGLDLE